MRKILSLAIVLSALLSLFPLTGCHKNKTLEEFQIPESFNESQQIEISFWAKNDTNNTQVNVYKKAIADFETLYPNIEVNLKLYTDYGKIYNDVITNIATGTTPNVCITYPDHIATYKQGKNVVAPLDELMNDKKYGLGGSEVKFDSVKVTEIVPKFLEECIIDENYYALPYLRSTEACYINADYVKALGYEIPEQLTWDWIFEVSEKAISEKNQDGTYFVNGKSTLIPFIYKSTDNMMIQMLKQRGAEYSNQNGDILIFNNDTKDILYTISEHAESRAFSTFKISSYPANFLNAGECIFAIDSTAGATWMGSSAPLIDIPENKLVNFETVVKPIPQYDTENPAMISQGPSMCIFNKENNQEVLASWLFMQFMLTDSVQIAYSQTEGYVPVTTKAQNSDQYLNYLSRSGEDNDLYYKVKIDATKLMLENIENTFVTPVFSNSASLRNAAGQMIEDVTRAKRRGKAVDSEFIENLYSEMNSLYKLEQLTPDEHKDDLGPLPSGAVALIVSLCTVWGLIIIFAVLKFIKVRKQKRLSIDIF